MRAFAPLVTILLATAVSDLSIYSEAKYSSQDEAPILVEWFHGADDENKVEELAQMDRDGEITCFIGALVLMKKEGLPDDDANSS